MEAMDLVAVTDTRLGINQLPVRLPQARRPRSATCSAGEEFRYGLNHPDAKGTTSVTGSLVQSNVAGTPSTHRSSLSRRSSFGPGAWFIACGADPNYGGCGVFVSLDGGVTYGDSPIADLWPAHNRRLLAQNIRPASTPTRPTSAR